MPSLTAREPAGRRKQFGFSLIEAVMVLLIIGTVLGALTPSVVRQITHARVNRAARVIAADVYLAQSTASRSRKPVQISIDSTVRTMTLRDAQSGTTLTVRYYGTDSEFKLARLYATPNTILVFPSTMGSGTMAIVVGDASYARSVNVSRAGQVRVQ